MASFFRNPPRTYSRRGKPAAPAPTTIKADNDRAPLSDKSLNKEQGRIVQDHLFSSSDNLESSSSFSRPKRLARTAKANPRTNKENANDSTLDSDVSRKRKGSSDESSFDLSGCLSRARDLKEKKVGSNLKSQKGRTQPTRSSQPTQPTRSSQRAKTTTERKKKPAAKETVNTTDEFEKPKAKRLKKSTSKTNVSTAAKQPKVGKASKGPENIPDFKSFEDFELEVETTVNKSPEKADVNLLSPLRENSWENVSKNGGHVEEKENLNEEKKDDFDAAKREDLKDEIRRENDVSLETELEVTKDYSGKATTSASSKNETDDDLSSTGKQFPPKASFSSNVRVDAVRVDERRDVDRAQSSPFPSQALAASSLPRSPRPHSTSTASSSSPLSPKISSTEDDAQSSASSGRVFTAGEGKKAGATSSTDVASSSSCSPGVRPEKDASSPSSIGVAPKTTADSVEAPSPRAFAFKTPKRQEELQDFSRISFCSPVVAGNLTYDEDGPDIPVFGLKANHLRRVDSQTSTSTPVQCARKMIMNGSVAPGSPIVHTSIEKRVSSPLWNNITRRKRFERNRSSNVKDSLSGDSSITSGRQSGSPAPMGGRNRQRRNATSNSSASLQDSKMSADLFDASNSAFEPSLKAVKEIPSKLSLSHIVEESGESLRVPQSTDQSCKTEGTASARANDPEYATSNIDEITSRTESTSLVSKTEDAEIASEKASTVYGAAESVVSSIASNASLRDIVDDDINGDDRSRCIDDFDLLSPGFVGRGSLPNFHNPAAVASLWTNHSCPDLGRHHDYDVLINILIDDEPHMIHCCINDDPVQVAREFIDENHIDPQQLDVLADFIRTELHLRMAERDDEGQEDAAAQKMNGDSPGVSLKSSVLLELSVSEESILTDGGVVNSKMTHDSLLVDPATLSVTPSVPSDQSLESAVAVASTTSKEISSIKPTSLGLSPSSAFNAEEPSSFASSKDQQQMSSTAEHSILTDYVDSKITRGSSTVDPASLNIISSASSAQSTLESPVDFPSPTSEEMSSIKSTSATLSPLSALYNETTLESPVDFPSPTSEEMSSIKSTSATLSPLSALYNETTLESPVDFPSPNSEEMSSIKSTSATLSPSSASCDEKTLPKASKESSKSSDGTSSEEPSLHGERQKVCSPIVSSEKFFISVDEENMSPGPVPTENLDALISDPSVPAPKMYAEIPAPEPDATSLAKRVFAFDRRATVSLGHQAQVEKTRRGSRLSLVKSKSRVSHLEAPSSDSPRTSTGRRMSRLLRNGKTFLDTSPVKDSPPPLPPTMTLVDVVNSSEREAAGGSEKPESPVELSLGEGGISRKEAPSLFAETVTDSPQNLRPMATDVFKKPQLPMMGKPKGANRRPTRASTARTDDDAAEEKETRRRSIARNLRLSKKIVFSPESETSNEQGTNLAERSASPILNRKVDRRATVAAERNKDLLAKEERRATTVTMTPIQKLAQWRRGSLIGTPLSSTRSITPSAVEVTSSEASTSKAARNLKVNFEIAVKEPVKPGIAAQALATAEGETTSNSPVVVLKRLSSEEIASIVAPAAPATPAWKKSQRLLASPVVVLSPLVRHLRPAYLENSFASPPHLDHETSSVQLNESMDPDDARTRVLEVCSQSTELSFYDVYPKRRMAAMKKIGEGTYGEVYLSFDESTQRPVALKVIPIEGDDLVNDERQKTYAEMLSEAVITKEMSELSSDEDVKENVTPGFIRVNRICAFKGVYPPELLKKWDEWAKKNKSWNDRPDFYSNDQLFLVFEFSEGGSDLEKFKFGCPLDALSVFRQTMMALAVGEAELEFEHRDLHWGNILIKKLDSEERIEYALHGVRGEMTSRVRVAIIDFTLSRLKRSGLTQFTDLADDPDIFKGIGEEAGPKEGDYQFDCYRLMQEETGNEWKSHAPRTNVIWLHYLAKKLLGKINGMTKKQKASANWKTTFEKLSRLRSELLKCDTVADVVGMMETF